MTALNQYQRLEAAGLWRSDTQDQRREVIASVGDATLLISDMQDRPLAHWSIPAIHRANPGKFPAMFHPAGDSSETLELAKDQTEMIEAIGKLQRAIHRKDARPGRLRGVVVLTSIVSVAALGVFWFPGALRSHVTSVVPDINRLVIGQDILSHLSPVTGQACEEEIANGALFRLATRLGVPGIVVVPGGIQTTASLPGGTVLLSRTILEDHEDPAVAAGYVIAESLRSDQIDPLERLLQHGGLWASFRLLTTGQLSPDTLKDYAEVLVTEPSAPAEPAALAAKFTQLKVAASPYAYAVDISGETTIELIEADSVQSETTPIMQDGEWVALQEICNS